MDHAAAASRWRLYVVADASFTGGRPLADVVRAAIAGGADVVQLRDKESPTGVFYAAALAVKQVCEETGTPLIVNDRLDIALAIDAEGLHIGQADLPAPVARRLLGPQRILGLSAGNVPEARRAEEDGADYLGVGPVYEARATKPDAGEPVGLERIRTVSAAARVPVFGIGGIRAANAAPVLAAGAVGVAVISAVVAAPDVARAARTLKAALGVNPGAAS